MKEQSISAIILAGGKNTRFLGFNKALLKINEVRIIDLILKVLRSVFSQIIIITNRSSDFSEFKDIQIKKDLIKNRGPLGGIYTGLKAIDTEYAFFVACDMPFLNLSLIKRLLKISRDGNYDCIIPYTVAGIESLHGMYSKQILKKLESLLKTNTNLSVVKMLAHFNCKYVKIKKEELSSVLNINTITDLKKAII